MYNGVPKPLKYDRSIREYAHAHYFCWVVYFQKYQVAQYRGENQARFSGEKRHHSSFITSLLTVKVRGRSCDL